MLSVTLGLGAGCSLITENNRINHLNNQSRQAAASAAQKDLADFKDSEKGLTPVMLANLRARMALAATVSDVEQDVTNQKQVVGATTLTWSQLKTSFFADNFGITGNDPLTQFQAAIDARIATVSKLADVLAALKSAEAALAQQRQNTANQLTAQIGATPDASQKIPDNVIQAAIGFQTAVRNAAKALRDSEDYRARSTSLLDTLFQEVQNSRDPQAAWALVPLLQTGLDADSLALLNKYLEFLNDALKKISDQAMKDKGAPPAPTTFADAFSLPKVTTLQVSTPDEDTPALRMTYHIRQIDATLQNHVKSWTPELNTAAGAGERYRRNWHTLAPPPRTSQIKALPPGTKSFSEQLKDFAAKDSVKKDDSPTRLKNAINTLDFVYEKSQSRRNRLRRTATSVSSLDKAVKKEASFTRSPTNIPAPAPVSPKTPSGKNPVDQIVATAFAKAFAQKTAPKSPQAVAVKQKDSGLLDQIAKGDLTNIQTLINDLKGLNLDPTSLQNLLTNKSDLAADSQSIALNFIQSAILNIDPAATNDLTQSLKKELGPQGTQGLTDLGSRLLQVLSQPEAEKNQLIQFLAQVYGVEIELLKENSRHAEALNTVARLELARWQTLQTVGDDVLKTYDDNIHPSDTLFVGKPTGEDITPAHKVLPSIRSLALDADELGKKPSKKVIDQENYYTAIHQIAAANRLLAGYLLMDSLNNQYSADNALRLETELREHDLLLGGIEAELKEVSFGQSLNELAAYHSGGLTPGDFEAVAQDAALIFIGVQTNRIAK